MNLPSDLMTLAQAAKSLPTRPNVATVWRWASRGVRGIVLPTVKVGGRTFVSEAALDDYCAKLNGQTRATPSCERSRSKHEAEEYLAANGL